MVTLLKCFQTFRLFLAAGSLLMYFLAWILSSWTYPGVKSFTFFRSQLNGTSSERSSLTTLSKIPFPCPLNDCPIQLFLSLITDTQFVITYLFAYVLFHSTRKYALWGWGLFLSYSSLYFQRVPSNKHICWLNDYWLEYTKYLQKKTCFSVKKPYWGVISKKGSITVGYRSSLKRNRQFILLHTVWMSHTNYEKFKEENIWELSWSS